MNRLEILREDAHYLKMLTQNDCCFQPEVRRAIKMGMLAIEVLIAEEESKNETT